ncbi:MAG: hypothetical protein GX410_03965 [Elusimicrobia bacterium]|nr:hypothetical protein [Elusimicrobiota bacterium]
MNDTENKKLQWLPALSLACVLALSWLCGKRFSMAADSLDFSSHFDWCAALLNVALVLNVLAACFMLGKRLVDGLRLPGAGFYHHAGLGLLALNVLLLPLFFLNLFYPPVLAALFITLLVLLRSEAPALRSALRTRPALPLLLFGAAALLHLVNALLPVSYGESLGDAANNTFYVPMLFARNHGAFFAPYLGAILSKFCQYEVLGSALISLSNPGVVKIFGLSLLLLTAVGVKQTLDSDLRGRDGIWAAVLFLTAPALYNDAWFSFAHERAYQLFLTFFVFSCMLKGALEKEARWQYVGLLSAGVLLGVSAGGVFTAMAALMAVLLSPALWRGRVRGYLGAMLGAAALAAVFPVWNYINTGSPAPVLVFLNKLFPVSGGDVFNDYLAQRTGLFFGGAGVSFADRWLYFVPKYLYANFGLAAFGIVLAALYFLNPLAKISAPFVILPFLAAPLFFPQITRGEEHGRFLWDMFPLLSLLILHGFYVTCALLRGPGVFTEYEGLADNSPRAAKFLAAFKAQSAKVRWRQYAVIAAAAVLALYAGFVADGCRRGNAACVFSASQKPDADCLGAGALCSSAAQTADFVFGMAFGRHACHCSVGHKLRYLFSLDTLGQYLGPENADKDAFLNSRLEPGEKVLYFFHAQKIYSAVEKYQPSTVASVSGIYAEDGGKALALLENEGLSALCFDNKWGLADGDPGKSLILDALTPLFEPDFFSRHFIVVETGLPHFYLFRIHYAGLEGKALDENREALGKSGFFCELYLPLKKYSASAKRLEANPYSPEKMLAAFESYRRQHFLCPL